MRRKSLGAACCGLALLVAPLKVMAQTATDATAQAESEEIVVEARRSGAPMWEVTRGPSTVLFVGEIAEVPKATPWRPDRLEGATRRAQSVVLEARPSVSPGVLIKVMFHMRSLINLPKGKTSADYLSPAQQQRLEKLETAFGTSYRRRSFMLTSRDLLNRRLDFDRSSTSDASDIVRRAAHQANIPVRPVGRLNGGEMFNALLSAPPQSHIPCLETAMGAVEAGPEIIVARGEAWTRFDIPAVMASPLEIALGNCWPWTDVRFGPELRAQWVREIGRAQTQPGVTMMVIPLRILAERGGLLDQLQAEGQSIRGPKWRDAP